MTREDREFMILFTAVLGILVLFAVLMFFAARMISGGDEGASSDPLVQRSVAERIRPVVTLAELNTYDPDAGPEARSAPVARPKAEKAEPEAQAFEPAAAYQSACYACHGTGAAGAPKLGDQAAWGERIARGMDSLVSAAINGKGAMPAKGGAMHLSDDQIREIVEYMVAKSR